MAARSGAFPKVWGDAQYGARTYEQE